MRLTSLTINGFKSFGNRATVQFAPGVTAIVGPNGSGKSNVIDALRWATGGGRASEFRAGEKTELIFHGADGKKSQSYAEVEVELGHDTKRIHITRNLYRDGQSKLRLGGKNARFLDLEEELAGSGLGRNGLALIGQGEVSQVLMADPAKLLGYVAEAAGVGKFAARREQTQARLLTARDHLSRIEDVMREQQQRLDALQLEAGEAERATLLGRAVLQLRYSLSSRRVSGLTSELDTLKQQQDALRTAVEAGRDELTAARERWQKARVELATLEEAYRQALTETEARRGDLRVAQERLKNTQARRQALHEENQRATVEIERLTATEAPQPPQDDESELLESLEAASAQRNACQQQLAATENELQARSAQLEAARRDLHDAQAAVAEYQRRKAELEQSLEAVRTRLNDLKPNAGPNLDHQEARVRELRAQLTTQSQQAEAFREQLADLQQQHAHAVADEQATERHAARSRNTFETRRGYAQGPRQALTSGIAGVIGSVADLVRVPRPYEIAVGSALGRRAENVVVDDAATAQHVLAHLKQAGGWATLLPLDLIEARTPRLDPALAQAAGVIGLASDLIEFEPRYAGIFHQLLGSTLLIERMDQAVALARQFHQRPRMVTLEGDLLESYGAMSGGRRQSNTGLLGLAAEVDDAEEALTRARSRASELTRQLQTAQKTFRDLQATMQSQTEQLRQLESALARQREEQAGKRSRMEELSSRYTELEARLMALVEPEAPKGREPVELEAEVREAQERVGRLRQTSAEASERHAEARQKLALYRERRAGFQAAKRRYDDEQARLALLQAHQRSLKVALEEAAQEERQAQEAVDAAQAAVPRDLASKQTAFVEAGKQTTQAEEALSGLTQLQAERGRAHEELQLTLARREAALELAKEELNSFPEGLEAREGPTKGLRDALAEAERELKAIGPVNHRAQQDYETNSARLKDLRAQADDAAQAADELASVLADIDKETDSRLCAAIDRLQHAFTRHAKELFGEGAQAGIEVQFDEGRPAGLTIGLQPPGKRTRSLNLLSVGERTMGALAFLFALMSEGEGQRLPIAILDEVDAPLDEANIRRFRDFLQRLAAQGTQFVLITHQKATMEAADALWGVTTERGVSRLFSIHKPEAAPAS